MIGSQIESCARLSPKTSRDRPTILHGIDICFLASLVVTFNLRLTIPHKATNQHIIMYNDLCRSIPVFRTAPFPVARGQRCAIAPHDSQNLGLCPKPDKSKSNKRRSSLKKERRCSIRQTKSTTKTSKKQAEQLEVRKNLKGASLRHFTA
jgi:hypothetical protein